MDPSPKGLLKNWVPHLPSIAKTAILAAVNRSPNAEHQKWLTEVFIKMAQPILHTPTPLLASQEYFKRDPGIKGPIWVAKYTVPAPLRLEQRDIDLLSPPDGIVTVAEAMAFAIDTLSTYPEEKLCPIPEFDVNGVEVEWTAYRSNARRWTKPPSDLLQREMYALALRDVPGGEESSVVLHAHGGAFCLMDPASHRLTQSTLARESDSRVLAVRYRLSPQSIFPGAVMDMFLTYLALICPPPGAFHRPVPGYKIVLAGDSSGANLMVSLQILLVALLQHGYNKIRNPWHEEAEDSYITIPDPPTAALSISSPWLDITRSLPSATLNAQYDFIAPAPSLTDSLTSTSPLFPPDSIWPSQPIRTETYCEATMCAHPLVTSLMASKNTLVDFPSTYVGVGWEGMTDESEVLCRRIYEAKVEAQMRTVINPIPSKLAGKQRGRSPSSENWMGFEDLSRASIDSSTTLVETHRTVKSSFGLVFDGYTAMPHTFSSIPFNRAAKIARLRRADHIKRAVSVASRYSQLRGPRYGAHQEFDRASWTNGKRFTEAYMSFSDLAMSTGRDPKCGYERRQALTDEYVEQAVRHGRDFRVKLEAKLRQQAAEQIHDPSTAVLSQGKSPKTIAAISTWFWLCLIWFRDITLRLAHRSPERFVSSNT